MVISDTADYIKRLEMCFPHWQIRQCFWGCVDGNDGVVLAEEAGDSVSHQMVYLCVLLKKKIKIENKMCFADKEQRGSHVIIQEEC